MPDESYFISLNDAIVTYVTLQVNSESYGLAVEHLAHDQKVVGSIPMLDGNGVKAMPGSIPAPNPGSYNN